MSLIALLRFRFPPYMQWRIIVSTAVEVIVSRSEAFDFHDKAGDGQGDDDTDDDQADDAFEDDQADDDNDADQGEQAKSTVVKGW